MNNEETILDPLAFAESNSSKQNASTGNKAESIAPSKKEAKPAKGTNTAQKAAYAAGGFVAGAASMFAGDVMAAAKPNEEEELNDENETQQQTQHHSAPQHTTTQTQEPEQDISARQVSQTQEPELSIADIRQVDVDGNGQLDTVVELNNGVMFADLDHDGVADIAAADINGDDVIGNDEVVDVRTEHIVMPNASNGATYASHQSNCSDDVDVHVIEVGQADLDGNGIAENVAIVEIDGNEVMLVDIDQDNVADVIIADINGNGQIDGNEIGDISGDGLAMPTLSDGDLYMAQADMEPDYMNDADMGLYEA